MIILKKTEIILFDYGETLIYEPNFCPSAGNMAIYPYISENLNNRFVKNSLKYMNICF